MCVLGEKAVGLYCQVVATVLNRSRRLCKEVDWEGLSWSRGPWVCRNKREGEKEVGGGDHSSPSPIQPPIPTYYKF